MTWDEIGKSKYAMLTSYKKDGTPVGTPVWVAKDGDRIVVWTNPKMWKVKRIRRSPAVTLQRCDARGHALTGDVLAGHAEIQDAAGTDRTRDVVGKKYGLIGMVFIRVHKLMLGPDRSVGISIRQNVSS